MTTSDGFAGKSAEWREGYQFGIDTFAAELKSSQERGLIPDQSALKSSLSPLSCLKEQIDPLDQAIGKLSAAALQLSPKDDQIIAGHIRDSVALLLRHRHILRR